MVFDRSTFQTIVLCSAMLVGVAGCGDTQKPGAAMAGLFWDENVGKIIGSAGAGLGGFSLDATRNAYHRDCDAVLTTGESADVVKLKNRLDFLRRLYQKQSSKLTQSLTSPGVDFSDVERSLKQCQGWLEEDISLTNEVAAHGFIDKSPVVEMESYRARFSALAKELAQAKEADRVHRMREAQESTQWARQISNQLASGQKSAADNVPIALAVVPLATRDMPKDRLMQDLVNTVVIEILASLNDYGGVSGGWIQLEQTMAESAEDRSIDWVDRIATQLRNAGCRVETPQPAPATQHASTQPAPATRPAAAGPMVVRLTRRCRSEVPGGAVVSRFSADTQLQIINPDNTAGRQIFIHQRIEWDQNATSHNLTTVDHGRNDAVSKK